MCHSTDSDKWTDWPFDPETQSGHEQVWNWPPGSDFTLQVDDNGRDASRHRFGFWAWTIPVRKTPKLLLGGLEGHKKDVNFAFRAGVGTGIDMGVDGRFQDLQSKSGYPTNFALPVSRCFYCGRYPIELSSFT